MQIRSINIAIPKEVEYQGKKILTGIFKKPVKHPVIATKLGLDGDGQADLENHGGFDKAIYIYTLENYRYWEKTLGRSAFTFGQFGENLTVEGMPDERIHIGDIFEIGSTRMQVTQPRVPCYKLGIKMEMPKFLKLFMPSGRVGFYLRVLNGGAINQCDTIQLVKQDQQKLSIREAMLALIDNPHRQEIVKKALAIKALSVAWRTDLERGLTN